MPWRFSRRILLRSPSPSHIRAVSPSPSRVPALDTPSPSSPQSHRQEAPHMIQRFSWILSESRTYIFPSLLKANTTLLILDIPISKGF
ncbi:hypothetical protein QN277_014530 [Acacia crassicarpa]|uniref:Uncharacterized protein n=1 Tax=Acacia crassicarpa TaxID=499986 RepID=A0AAE1JG97_9FABA|nr:hypothetical protein QN277_014530 [Acacia crassicarpa]